MNYVLQGFAKVDLGLVQEVNGSHEIARQSLGGITNYADWYSSFCPNPDAGGVLIIWKKKLAVNAVVTHEVLVPGRAVRSVFH